MEAVRNAYRRAVQIPMCQVKRLWKEYREFENDLNKITVCALVPCASLSADDDETGSEAHLRLDTQSYASSHSDDNSARTSYRPHSTSSCYKIQHLASASAQVAQLFRRRQGSSR